MSKFYIIGKLSREYIKWMMNELLLFDTEFDISKQINKLLPQQEFIRK